MDRPALDRHRVRRLCCTAILTLAACTPAAAQQSAEILRLDSGAAQCLQTMSAGRTFDGTVRQMWTRSPTFRRQCRRLVISAPDLRVQLLVETSGRASIRARTVVERRGGRLVGAMVLVPSCPDAIELIAHEIEHLLEQVDAVDLRLHVPTGAAWTSGDGSYETRRAIHVGRQVAVEVAQPIAGDGR